MSEIRPLPEADLDAFVRIVANAYPDLPFASEEGRRRLAARLSDPRQLAVGARPFGCYRAGALVGAMRLYDFWANLFGVRALVGGVGLVGVDLLHKKEHVARDMIAAFLRHYRERGACLAALYPFRPDFYKRMGFGYGAKTHQYRLRPAQLPGGGDRARLAFLGRADAPALLACYNRYVWANHGMFEGYLPTFEAMFDNEALRVVGYRDGAELRGYLAFQCGKSRNFTQRELEIGDLIYEDRAALLALLAFVRAQADQYRTAVIHTLDPFFHFLPDDPLNDSGNVMPHVYHETDVAGVGLMYRVIDTPGLFALLADHSFGGLSLTLRLTLEDSFLPEQAGDYLIRFEEGRPHLLGEGQPDLAIRLGVAEFSSLVLGAVPFERLYTFGRAALDDPAHLPLAERLFRAERAPVCLTRF